MSKNIDEQVDKLEAAVDPNTVISIGGYNFTPAKLMIAGGILSTIVGGMWGAFEIWKDYQNMKEAIQTYVAPDLSELNKKIELIGQNSEKTLEFTNEIKNDLKQDIRRLEGVVEGVERSSKQLQRETMQDVKDMRNELREVRKEVDVKIKQALDNPLAQ